MYYQEAGFEVGFLRFGRRDGAGRPEWAEAMMWRQWVTRWRRPRVSAAQAALLTAMWQGDSLKSHRTVEGEKWYRLHGISGTVEVVSAETVHQLRRAGCIETNHKFPVATYSLTTAGKARAARVVKEGKRNPHSADPVNGEVDGGGPGVTG